MSETQTQSIPDLLPASLSPQEGILVLSLLLRTQVLRLREALRLVKGDARTRLEAVLKDKEELTWRCQSLLGSLDANGFREGGVSAALVERCRLQGDVHYRRRIPGRLFKRRQVRQRLEELGGTERTFELLAGACRERFQESMYRDEFRICAQMAEDHLHRVMREQQAA